MDQQHRMISAITAYTQTLFLRLAISRTPFEDPLSKEKQRLLAQNHFDLTAKKLLLAPFILIQGSQPKHRELLFDVYGNFIPTAIGIVNEFMYRQLIREETELSRFLGLWKQPCSSESVTGIVSVATIQPEFFADMATVMNFLAASWNVDRENLMQHCAIIRKSARYIIEKKFPLATMNDDALSYWGTSGIIYQNAHAFFKNETASIENADQETDQYQLARILFNHDIQAGRWSYSYG